MQRHLPTLSLLPTLVILSLAASAQAAIELPRPSPAATVSQRVGLTDISVEYSSPGVKDRKIWGKLVPYDELWRTGANAATKITFSKDVKIDGKDVPAGTYAVLTIPTKRKWTFILNSDSAMSGTRSYDKAKDVLRAEVSTDSISRRQRMTFLFDDTTDEGTDLRLEWDKLAVIVPIEVTTAEQALENINRTARDLSASARYLLDRDEDPARALQLAESAVAIDPTWVNTYVLARAQAANDRFADATETARTAHELGMKADYFFWKDNVEESIKKWSKKAE